MCIAGVDGYFRRVNPRFSQLLGYTEEELLSRPFVDFIHPEDIQLTEAEVTRQAQGIPARHVRNRYRRKDGQYVALEWSTSPDPETGELFATARDVTDQLEAEARLQSMVVNNPGMVYQFRITPDGEASFILQGAKVIILTGRMDLNDPAYESVRDKVHALLKKPFTESALMKTLQELEARPTA